MIKKFKKIYKQDATFYLSSALYEMSDGARCHSLLKGRIP